MSALRRAREGGRVVRSLVGVAAALLVGLSAPPSPARASPPAWPQATSDLPPDPGIRFGVLPNGLRYAVMRNATPAGQTSLRLRIGAGSLDESDADQGLAHLLEHMAFKGSAHVPPDEMTRILQRLGLAFGADTNAETEWTQTVFQFDLPRSDPASLSTGLDLMREIAGNLTLSAAALATERGVVLSEERLRDTPEYRAQKAQIDLLAHGQLAARRFPIGLVPVIEHATPAQLRAFYQSRYRPQDATLVVVGDIEPGAVEAKLRADFAGWRDAAPPGPAPELGAVAPRGLTVRLTALPGSATRTMVAWARPYDDRPDTLAKRRGDVVEALGLAVLNRRFQSLAQGPNPPFLAARAGFDNLLHSDKVASVEAISPPAGWRAALAALETEVRRIVTTGVAAGELDREIRETRAGLVQAVAGAATRRTPELANDIVDTVDSDQVFTSPAEDLAIFEAAARDLTTAEVETAVRGVFAGPAGPLVMLATPSAPPGGEAAVAEAFRAAEARPLASAAAQASVRWPYESFGAPGRVAGRQPIADVGATRVRFANGIALTVKPTAFVRGQVLVSVRVGGGRLSLPKVDPSLAWTASALIAGGFDKLALDDAQRALAGKVYGATVALDDDALDLRGSTQAGDLSTQLQVLAAYVAHPGFRPEAFARLRAGYLAALPQLAATPEGVFERDGPGLLHGGDPRWRFPAAASIETAPADAPRRLLADMLANNPLEVTIIGDIGLDQAIAATAATFGALPRRPPPAAPPGSSRHDSGVRFPAPTLAPVRLVDAGRPDQALAAVAWPTTDFFVDMKGARAMLLAGEALQNRVTDELRIAQGLTYSPRAEVDFSETLPGYGAVSAVVEAPPDKAPAFFDAMARIAADLRDKPIGADELARALRPRVAGIEKARLGNDYWLEWLSGSAGDPRRLDLIRTTLPDYASLTAADVQAAARRWLRPETAWKLVIGPEGR